MKSLLFILLFSVSFSAFSQQPTGSFTKPNNSRGITYNGVMAEKEIYFPIYDTMFTPLRQGAVTRRPQDTTAGNNIFYTWIGYKWTAIDIAGGGGGGTSYTGGLWTTIDGTEINSDSAAMAAYFLRRSGTISGQPVTGKIQLTANEDEPFQFFFGNPSSGPFASIGSSVGSDLLMTARDGTGNNGAFSFSGASLGIAVAQDEATQGHLNFNAISGLSSQEDFSANYDPLTYVQKIYTDKNLDTLYRSGDSLIVFKKNGTRWGIYSPTSTGGGGTGTVSTLSVTTANGISGTVANASTTPAITLNLDATRWQTKAATKTTSDSVVALIPTNNNTLTNGAGYITSSSLTPYLQVSDSTKYSTKANATKQRDSVQANVTAEVSRATAAEALKADKAGTITINGNSQTLGSNPTFTVSGGGSGSLSTNDSLKVSQSRLNRYVSNAGSNSNLGTNIDLPKSTLSGTLSVLSSGQTVKIKPGSYFDFLNLSTTGLRSLTFEGDDIEKNNSLPLVTGDSVVGTWSATSGSSVLFQNDFINNGLNPTGNYNTIPVTEIDTALEKVAPFTARKSLTVVYTQADAEALAGSVYVTPVASGATATVYIHPTSGNPSSNVYRYEVGVKSSIFYANRQTVANQSPNMTVRNMIVRGAQNGYGMIAGADSSLIDGVIFQGGPIHQVVIFPPATINRSLFIRGTKGISNSPIAFYRPQGLGTQSRFILSNSVSLDNYSLSLSHISTTTNHGHGFYENIWFFPDTTDARGTVFTANNTDSITINGLYANKTSGILTTGTPTIVDVRNSVLRDGVGNMFYGSMSSLKIYNTFIGINTTQALYSTYSYSYPMYFASTTINTQILNSTVHLKSRETHTVGTAVGTRNMSNSIVICDVDNGVSSATSKASVGDATSVTFDYNVYVLYKGKFMFNGGTFAAWQATGKDVHSKFIDLSTNPIGLKALFADPDNGDYSLVDGGWGDTVRAVAAGMVTPIRQFAVKPSYEEAANWIKSGNIPRVTDLFRSARKPAFVVTTDNSGILPALDGSLLTNVAATPVGNEGNLQIKSNGVAFGTDSISYSRSTATLNVSGNLRMLNKWYTAAGTTTYYDPNGVRVPSTWTIADGSSNTLFQASLTALTAGANITSNTILNGYLTATRTTNNVSLLSSPGVAGATLNFNIGGNDGAYSGQTVSPGDVNIRAPKNTTTGLAGNVILAWDGTNKRQSAATGGLPIAGAVHTFVGQYEGIVVPRITTTARDSLYKNLKISITSPGSGYSNGNKLVSFSGGTGVGATATLVVGGNIFSSISGFNQGYGWSTTAPTVTTTATGGTGGAITASLALSDGVIIYNTTTKSLEISDSVNNTWNTLSVYKTAGAAATAGTATLVSGAVTVNTTAVTAGSVIQFSYQNCSSCGTLYKGTVTAGTSFVINSTNASDASSVSWRIIY